MTLYPLTKDLHVTNTVDLQRREDTAGQCLKVLFDRALNLEVNSTKKEPFEYTLEDTPVSFNFLIGNLEGNVCFAIPYSKNKEPLDKKLFRNPKQIGEGNLSTAYLAHIFIQIPGQVAWKMGSITLLEVKDKRKFSSRALYTRGNAVLSYVHQKRVQRHVEPKGILHKGSRYVRIVEYFPNTISSPPLKQQCFQELIQGVQELIKIGVYHFDIKPDNTLVKDRAVVIDFPDPIFLEKDLGNTEQWRENMLKRNQWKQRTFPLILTHTPSFAHPSIITFRDEFSQVMARIEGNQTVSNEEIAHLQMLGEKEISFMLAKTILFTLLKLRDPKANALYFSPKEVHWRENLKLTFYCLTDKGKLTTALQCPEELKLIILQGLEDNPLKRPSLTHFQKVLG